MQANNTVNTAVLHGSEMDCGSVPGVHSPHSLVVPKANLDAKLANAPIMAGTKSETLSNTDCRILKRSSFGRSVLLARTWKTAQSTTGASPYGTDATTAQNGLSCCSSETRGLANRTLSSSGRR